MRLLVWEPHFELQFGTPGVHRDGEASEEIKTIPDGKFNAGADKGFESQQMPMVCSSLPPSAIAQLALGLLGALFRVHALSDVCSSPEGRFGPLCQRVSSTHLLGPHCFSSSHPDTDHRGLLPPRSAGSVRVALAPWTGAGSLSISEPSAKPSLGSQRDKGHGTSALVSRSISLSPKPLSIQRVGCPLGIF